MIEKSGTAVWEGSLKEGKGRISTQSGALTDQPYGFATRFETAVGTNPEELIGAAHASCFAMALSNILGQKGVVADEIDATSRITLDPKGGPAITKAHLEVVIHAEAEEELLLSAAAEAKANCPVSKLLRAEITMDARKG